MPVRAVDDKSSDTLVVVSGEGFWTGSSTLPHLHHFFARSQPGRVRLADASPSLDRPTMSDGVKVRCPNSAKHSPRPGCLSGAPIAPRIRRACSAGVSDARRANSGRLAPGPRGSPRTPRLRNAGRRVVAASAPWTPEPHPDRTLEFADLDGPAVDHRTARPLYEGADQDEGDGDRDDQRDHAKGQAVLTPRAEHALPIDERTPDDATGGRSSGRPRCRAGTRSRGRGPSRVRRPPR